MSKRKRDWEDYKNKIAKKRTGKKEEAGPSGLTGTITVQRLSPNVEGKCQKYARIGLLTLVPLEDEATLPNIKAACKAHFGTHRECDVWLANVVPRTRMPARSKTGKSSTYVSLNQASHNIKVNRPSTRQSSR